MNVAVLAGVNSKFGELWNTAPRDLATKVVDEAIYEAGIKKTEIEAVFVANMLSGTLGGQDHLGAFFAEELGLPVAAFKIEGACASGGLAVHAGVMAISSGLYNTVLVLGLEKMTDHKPEEVAKALMGAGSDTEREAGATFPALYAMIARLHMEKYGTTEEQMAAVAVKNHYHASLNSHAQFRNEISIEKVMKSSSIASPLKLLDCSPMSDGASALILSNTKGGEKSNNQTIKIIASAVSTDSLGLSEREDLTSIHSAKRAAEIAYHQAKLNPSDIDIAEVHDCFTIAEIIAMEDLGFFKKGEAAQAIFDGKTTLGKGRLVVNTSGGLKAAGHPVGATGIKQVVEIYQQLSGKAGNKQVIGVKYGLTHNVGGSGATAVVHILKK
jgi:acetyl-CoA C-acetyltransferase